MDDIRNSLKTPDKKQKNSIYIRIAKNYMHKAAFERAFFSKEKMIGILTNEAGCELSLDEITAISNLIYEFCLFTTDQMKYFGKNKDKERFIHTIFHDNDVDEKKIIEVINALVKDVNEFTKLNQSKNVKYSINFKYLFEIMSGKDPYLPFKEEAKKQEAKLKARNKFKIVK